MAWSESLSRKSLHDSNRLRACPESLFMIPTASGEPSIEIKAHRP